MPQLGVRCETFEFIRPFATSGGAMDCLTVLVAEVASGEFSGRGEGVPSGARMVSRDEGRVLAEHARAELLEISSTVEAGLDRSELTRLLPPGPARNALDCALWDLEAKKSGSPVWQLLGLTAPQDLVSAYTIPLGDPASQYQDAFNHRDHVLLKLKLGGTKDLDAVSAVRRAAPGAHLIVDVNGAWSLHDLRQYAPALDSLGVVLIEQPLPPHADAALEDFRSPVPLCADESCHVRADLDRIPARYQYVNIKLDKCGGLTEALALAREAQQRGLGLMAGCMAGTSLSMAPAAVLGSLCEYLDLDGPLLLRQDRDQGFTYECGRFRPVNARLWG